MDTTGTVSIDSGSIQNHPPDVEGDRTEDASSIQGDSAYHSESLAGREMLNSVKPPELRLEELYSCTITRSDSPIEFWVRLSGWEEKMAEITQRLRQRYHDAGSPGQFDWREGDYCAVRFPRTSDWLRVLITKVSEEQVEVVLIDHGISRTAPLRLLKPIPEQISQIDWLSIKVKIAQMEPLLIKDGKWRKEVVSKVQEYIELADRFAIEVSAPTDKPYVWMGEVFFYLDSDYMEPPLIKTHRVRASRVLEISREKMLENVRSQLEETSM